MTKAVEYIQKSNNDIIIFDQDGVIADYDYEGNYSKRPYLSKRPIKAVLDLIENLINSGKIVYIVTIAYSVQQVHDKLLWIKSNIPNFPEEQISILNKELYPRWCDEAIKLQRIQAIMEGSKGGKLVIIEDSISVLNTIKSFFPTAYCVHVSSLYD